EPGRVFGQRTLEQREVEPRDVLGDVDQRIVGNRVEEDGGVSQAEVDVDQRHRVPRVGRQGATQVHRDAGGAHSAGGPGNGNDGAAAELALATAVAVFADSL